VTFFVQLIGVVIAEDVHRAEGHAAPPAGAHETLSYISTVSHGLIVEPTVNL
jgi:hypothetical protein